MALGYLDWLGGSNGNVQMLDLQRAMPVLVATCFGMRLQCLFQTIPRTGRFHVKITHKGPSLVEQALASAIPMHANGQKGKFGKVVIGIHSLCFTHQVQQGPFASLRLLLLDEIIPPNRHVAWSKSGTTGTRTILPVVALAAVVVVVVIQQDGLYPNGVKFDLRIHVSTAERSIKSGTPIVGTVRPLHHVVVDKGLNSIAGCVAKLSRNVFL